MGEPVSSQPKRAVAFFDGQNLFHAARRAFGVTWPNFDPSALAHAVCEPRGWDLDQVRFYTGIPSMRSSPFWSRFWLGKLTALGRQGVHVTSRALRDRQHSIVLPDGGHHRWLAPEEKGIDVRIAVDLVGMAYRRLFDVAIIFSQDQDLAEVVDEIKHVARLQRRWIKVASAFPAGPSARIQYGVAETDWIPIDAATYERCLDPRDYRPRRNPS